MIGKLPLFFYSALHFVNAHVKKTLGLYHTTHKELAHAINPFRNVSHPAQLSEDAFIGYEALFVLSRRSRYLYSEKSQSASSFTYHKHLAKALRHLDTVMTFIDSTHNIGFNKRSIKCPGLKQGELTFFDIKK